MILNFFKVEFYEKVNGFWVYEEQTLFQMYHGQPVLVRMDSYLRATGIASTGQMIPLRIKLG